jgi:hypothetical protein
MSCNLTTQFQEAALVFGWLEVGSEHASSRFQVLGRINEALLLNFFRTQTLVTDTVKSLRPPLDIIPASLHPDQ